MRSFMTVLCLVAALLSGCALNQEGLRPYSGSTMASPDSDILNPQQSPFPQNSRW
jgi:hypothetical protein